MGGDPPYDAGEVGKTAPIKKAAANAAAKVRRWIKELQINVSEHRAINRTFDLSEICQQWLELLKVQCLVLHGVSRESAFRIRS